MTKCTQLCNRHGIKPPLKHHSGRKELMTAHFNLVVLTNKIDENTHSDAQKPEVNNLDAETVCLSSGMRRPTSRSQVGITLQIVIQGSSTLPEQSFQPAGENTDLLTEYRQVTRVMTLGTMILILMSTHIHTT